MQIPTYNENRMNEAIKAFTEKKATAETIGIVTLIGIILYVGLIIYTICVHHYENLIWEGCVFILFISQYAKDKDMEKTCELAISAIELAQIDREIMLHDISHWHDMSETPENKSYVLAFHDGKYVVMFYRDALFEFPPYYECEWAGTTSVDRWMYIPGNTANEE